MAICHCDLRVTGARKGRPAWRMRDILPDGLGYLFFSSFSFKAFKPIYNYTYIHTPAGLHIHSYCTCMNVNNHIVTYVWVHIQTHKTCEYTVIHINSCSQTYIRVDMRMYTWMGDLMCYMYIHTCIYHTDTHIYVHTYAAGHICAHTQNPSSFASLSFVSISSHEPEEIESSAAKGWWGDSI